MSKRSNPTLRSPNPIKHHLTEACVNEVIVGPTISAQGAPNSESSPPALRDATTTGDSVDAASPPRAQAVVSVQSPSSPGNNRAAFLQKFTPSRVLCNVELCRSPPGSKIHLTAIVIAVFPATTNPDRRYVQLADESGSVGITVWNDNVSRFSRQSVGQVVQFGKIVLGAHHSKKNLTMTRDSQVEFPDVHPLQQWWINLLPAPPVTLLHFQLATENSIVNVAGILGMITEEVKIVHNVAKTLVTLLLADPSGELHVKTWNHVAADFHVYSETPVLIQRVRVTSFNGVKFGELLDNGGSVFVTEFKGKKVLSDYWVN